MATSDSTVKLQLSQPPSVRYQTLTAGVLYLCSGFIGCALARTVFGASGSYWGARTSQAAHLGGQADWGPTEPKWARMVFVVFHLLGAGAGLACLFAALVMRAVLSAQLSPSRLRRVIARSEAKMSRALAAVGHHDTAVIVDTAQDGRHSAAGSAGAGAASSASRGQAVHPGAASESSRGPPSPTAELGSLQQVLIADVAAQSFAISAATLGICGLGYALGGCGSTCSGVRSCLCANFPSFRPYMILPFARALGGIHSYVAQACVAKVAAAQLAEVLGSPSGNRGARPEHPNNSLLRVTCTGAGGADTGTGTGQAASGSPSTDTVKPEGGERLGILHSGPSADTEVDASISLKDLFTLIIVQTCYALPVLLPLWAAVPVGAHVLVVSTFKLLEQRAEFFRTVINVSNADIMSEGGAKEQPLPVTVTVASGGPGPARVAGAGIGSGQSTGQPTAQGAGAGASESASAAGATSTDQTADGTLHAAVHNCLKSNRPGLLFAHFLRIFTWLPMVVTASIFVYGCMPESMAPYVPPFYAFIAFCKEIDHMGVMALMLLNRGLALEERRATAGRLKLEQARTALQQDLQDKRNKFLRYIFHEARVPLHSASMALEALEEETAAARETAAAASARDPTAAALERPVVQTPAPAPQAPGQATEEQADGAAELLGVARSSVASVVGIINSVLTLSSIEADAFKVNPSAGDFLDMLQTTVQQLRPHASRIHATLDFEVGPGVPGVLRPEVSDTSATAMTPLAAGITWADSATPYAGQSTVRLLFDRLRLGQVVSNLCSNALKFINQEGLGRVKVTASLVDIERHDSAANVPGLLSASGSTAAAEGTHVYRLRVEVADNGMGIPLEEQAKLFQPYQQVQSGNAQAGAGMGKREQGTGLGLSIAKEIVTRHGGAIGVRSAGAGMGSTFWFEVRLPQAVEQDGGAETARSQRAAAQAARDVPVKMSLPAASSTAAPSPSARPEQGTDVVATAVVHAAADEPLVSDTVSPQTVVALGTVQPLVLPPVVANAVATAVAAPRPDDVPAAGIGSTVTHSQGPRGPRVGTDPAANMAAAVASAAMADAVQSVDTDCHVSRARVPTFGRDVAAGALAALTLHRDRSPAGMLSLGSSRSTAGAPTPTTAQAAGASGQGWAGDSGTDTAVPASTSTAVKRPSSDASASSTTAVVGSFAPPRPMSILLVDDSDSNRRLLARVVKGRLPGKPTVLAASDGQQAVDIMREVMDTAGADVSGGGDESAAVVPSIVLMDGNMPVLDGYAATRHLRSQLNYNGLIVGITGNALQEDQDKFKASGADAVLVKPVTAAQLLEACQPALPQPVLASQGSTVGVGTSAAAAAEGPATPALPAANEVPRPLAPASSWGEHRPGLPGGYSGTLAEGPGHGHGQPPVYSSGSSPEMQEPSQRPQLTSNGLSIVATPCTVDPASGGQTSTGRATGDAEQFTMEGDGMSRTWDGTLSRTWSTGISTRKPDSTLDSTVVSSRTNGSISMSGGGDSSVAVSSAVDSSGRPHDSAHRPVPSLVHAVLAAPSSAATSSAPGTRPAPISASPGGGVTQPLATPPSATPAVVATGSTSATVPQFEGLQAAGTDGLRQRRGSAVSGPVGSDADAPTAPPSLR